MIGHELSKSASCMGSERPDWQDQYHRLPYHVPVESIVASFSLLFAFTVSASLYVLNVCSRYPIASEHMRSRSEKIGVFNFGIFVHVV